MARNGAFRGPSAGSRFRDWWYGQSSAARVNKLLLLAAGISLVAFVSAASRSVPRPTTGLATATVPRPAVTLADAISTTISATTPPESTAPAAPQLPGSTPSSAAGPTATVRPTTTTTGARSPARSTPTPAGDPGVIFSEAPARVVPPATTTSTTTPTTSPATSTTTPTTTPTTSTTTTTTAAALLPLLGPLGLPLLGA